VNPVTDLHPLWSDWNIRTILRANKLPIPETPNLPKGTETAKSSLEVVTYFALGLVVDKNFQEDYEAWRNKEPLSRDMISYAMDDVISIWPLMAVFLDARGISPVANENPVLRFIQEAAKSFKLRRSSSQLKGKFESHAQREQHDIDLEVENALVSVHALSDRLMELISTRKIPRVPQRLRNMIRSRVCSG
jgi:ribonuclease D